MVRVYHNKQSGSFSSDEDGITAAVPGSHHAHMNHDTDHTQQSLFMTMLPPEIRCVIYRLVFARGAASIRGGTWSKYSSRLTSEAFTDIKTAEISPVSLSFHRKTPAGMLLVSKPCRAEALPIFWQTVTLQIGQAFAWESPKVQPLFELNDGVMLRNLRVIDEAFILGKSPSPQPSLDYIKAASLRRRAFPMLKKHFFTPIIRCGKGVHISCKRTAEVLDPAFEAAIARETEDPSKHGVAGFLRSDILQQKLLEIVKATRDVSSAPLRCLADALHVQSEESTLDVDVIVDLPFYIHLSVWKLWPGIACEELKTVPRFGDRVPKFIRAATFRMSRSFSAAVRELVQESDVAADTVSESSRPYQPQICGGSDG
jgi:hypothetical protein